MNTKRQPSMITNISKKSIIIFSTYIIAALIMSALSIFPLISELSFRKAHLLSTEAKIQNFRFKKRFIFAFEEFEKAISFYPWETHYAMEYLKQLDIYTKRVVKDKNTKIMYYLKILNILNRIQYIDPINPWYNSKRSNILTELYRLTNKKMYVKEAFKYSKIAALNDHENPIFLLNYANIAHQNSLYSEAFYYYSRAINILGADRYEEAFYNLAEIYTVYNDRESALQLFLKVKELNPSFKNIDVTIIRSMLSLERYDESEQYIQQLNIDQSTDKHMINTLAILYFKSEDFEKSLYYLDRYINLPEFVTKSPEEIIYRLYLDNYKSLNYPQEFSLFLETMKDKYPDSPLPAKFEGLIKKNK